MVQHSDSVRPRSHPSAMDRRRTGGISGDSQNGLRPWSLGRGYLLVRCAAVFASGLLWCCTGFADEKGSAIFRQHIAEWEAAGVTLVSGSVSYQKSYDDRAGLTSGSGFRGRVDDDFFVKDFTYQRQGRSPQRGAVIQNPSYYALLGLGLRDEWTLQKLVVPVPEIGKLDSDNVFARDNSTDDFLGQIASPGNYMCELMQGDAVIRVLEGREDDGTITYEVELDPERIPWRPKFERLRVSFRDDISVLPVRIDHEFTRPERMDRGSRLFSEWIEVRKVFVPQVMTYYGNDAHFAEGQEPLATTVWDYSSIDQELDTSRCYLTYYGLPEPDGISPGWFRSWWWVILAAGAASYAMWRFYRQTQA